MKRLDQGRQLAALLFRDRIRRDRVWFQYHGMPG